MKARMRASILAFSTLATLATACSPTIAVESSPAGAEIALEVEGDDVPRVLGYTPFKTTGTALSDLAGTAPKRLVVRKQGFRSESFLVPETGGDLAIRAALAADAANYAEINRYVRLVLKGQRLLLQRRFEETMKVAAEIRRASENVASAYELEGTVYYLTDKMAQARAAWARVIELEPDNDEARGMLTLIEARLETGARNR